MGWSVTFSLALARCSSDRKASIVTDKQFHLGEQFLINMKLFEPPIVRSLVLRTYEGLRRSRALGDVRAIALVFVNLLVEMLAALLPNGEAAHALNRIAQKQTQRATICALARECGVARPVLRRLDRLGCCHTQFRDAMLQDPGKSLLRCGN